MTSDIVRDPGECISAGLTVLITKFLTVPNKMPMTKISQKINPVCFFPLCVVGEKSSNDEQVACAMLGTQLDTFLGGEPIQHREVQGCESSEFMSLFPRGVSYKVRTDALNSVYKKTFIEEKQTALCFVFHSDMFS